MSHVILQQQQGKGERTMASLRSHGVLGLDLERRPSATDWLLLVLDNDGLVVIRTDPAAIDDRLGVIVHASRPPNAGAIRILEQLASGDRAGCEASRSVVAEDAWCWALETSDRIITALHGS